MLVGRISDQGVLRVGDPVLHHPDAVHLIIQLHFLDDGFQQALGVCGVINREIGRVTDMLRLVPEDTGEDGMEGSHP